MAQKWQRVDAEGHDDSVTVGSCERIEVGTVAEAIANGWISAEAVSERIDQDTTAVWGFGELFDDVDAAEMPRLAEDVAEAKLLLSKRVIGPSVDAGSVDAVWVAEGTDEPMTDEMYERMYEETGREPKVELLFTRYQIGAATLVTVPAYEQCRPFELLSDEPVGITAAIRDGGWDELPLAERDREWDGDAAAQALADLAGLDGDTPDWDLYAQGFLYRDDQADPETRGAYGFGIVDVVDGDMTVVPRAVFTVANVLSDGMGGTTIPEADQTAMRAVVERLYGRMADEWDDPTVVAPWTAQTAAARRQLATTLTTTTHRHDPALFADPGLDRLTPLTLTPDGRIVGHLASHDVCHVGIRHECVTAPVDPGDYSAFHRYPLDTTDGTIAVGRLTWGGGEHRCGCRQCRSANDDHACLGLSAVGAMAHHDQLDTIAWVRCGEDPVLNAIWVSGILADDVDDTIRTRLASGQRISGDWRPVAGGHRLVEILALSRESPGYPLLPRTSMRSGKVMAITAAGMVHHPSVPAGLAALTDTDLDRLASRLADEVAAGVVDRLVALTPPGATDPPPEPGPDAREEAIREARGALAAAYRADLSRVVR